MKTKTGITILIILLLGPFASGQGRNNNYLFGYGGWPRAQMNFPGNIPNYWVNPAVTMGFQYTHANISDSAGNLLLYTNGVCVMDANHDTMPNGKGLNPCYYTTLAQYDGLSLIQADLILPDPGNVSCYYLIHQSINTYPNDVINTVLYYSKIDITLNNGKGNLIQKNIPILVDDSLAARSVTACRHANGRDWWVVVPRAYTPEFHIFLLSPVGFNLISTQSIGQHYYSGGQTAFSMDGSKYGSYGWDDGVEIFDFDRCTGIFSNCKRQLLNDTTWGLGFCFSPDSKKAYVGTAFLLFQINLDSSSIASGLQVVAEWDSTYNPGIPVATTFEFMQIGPDGKIYMTTVWATPNMHIIEFPDSLGPACHVQQHIISLPTTNGTTIPNFINYSLGALTGSGCDSLGQGVPEHALHNFRFSIRPNPLPDKMIHCKYVLSQSAAGGNPGTLEVLDLTGRILLKEYLPPWSTEQHLKFNASSGMYLVRIISDKQQACLKISVQ